MVWDATLIKADGNWYSLVFHKMVVLWLYNCHNVYLSLPVNKVCLSTPKLGCITFGLGQKVLSRLAWSKFRPNLPSQETLTDFHEAKKNQNGRLSKTEIFKTTNSQNIFVKISWIGSWISGIDWCKGRWRGSTYMVGRLSDKSSKKSLKHKKCVFPCFWVKWL